MDFVQRIVRGDRLSADCSFVEAAAIRNPRAQRRAKRSIVWNLLERAMRVNFHNNYSKLEIWSGKLLPKTNRNCYTDSAPEG